jgi:polyhydroxyalkanoate synthase
LAQGPSSTAWREELIAQAINWPFYESLDAMRRSIGDWLDGGPSGRRETPHRIVHAEPGVSLRAYDADHRGPAVLLVPAPIKGGYIWDLLPRVSVVRHLLRRGVRVYLVDWSRPTPREQGLGLGDYADRLLAACVDAIERETGERRTLVAAHSLGGTFAAIFAALHPDRIRALALLGAPINFGRDFGAFAPIVALSPPAERLAPSHGNIPGSFLNSVSLMASPTTFAWSRFEDFVQCLPDGEAMASLLAVERWTLDEKPLAEQLFVDVWEQLFRANRFMAGTLIVNGIRAAPASVTSPLACVVDARCAIAPPQAVLPFHAAAGAAEKRLLWYEGDVGVSLQHVGMLVGRNAHERLWPELADWMLAHARAARPAVEQAADAAVERARSERDRAVG